MKKTKQTTFAGIDWIGHIRDLVKRHIISKRATWLLTGNYKTLKELPSVEEHLSGNVKSNLEIQRLLARQNFRGIVSNRDVMVVGFLKNVGAILGNTIMGNDAFLVEEGNSGFENGDRIALLQTKIADLKPEAYAFRKDAAYRQIQRLAMKTKKEKER